MKYGSLALFALLLAACSPPQARETQTAQIPNTPVAPVMGCSVEASRDWSAVGSQYYLIEAEAEGETCREATATLRIKTPQGAVLFERAYPTAQVPLAFSPVSDRTGLQAELDAWLQNTADPQTADTLPPWPARAERPPGFQPAAGVTRNVYENARGAQGPLFCYPDGGESNACIAMSGDRATLLGSLTPERV